MRRLLLPVLLAVLVLAGCSGDDDPEPKIAPSDSSSAAAPAPSPTPAGPVEPTLPAEAAGEDAAAAEAFVRFYWEMVNYAEQTGELSGLTAIALDSCAACSGGAKDIERIYANDGRVVGGLVEVTSTSSTPFESGPTRGYAVVAEVNIAPQDVTEPGKEVQHFDGGPNEFRFIVQREVDGWVVARWDPAS